MRIAFRLDIEFNKAILYTMDIWLREEEGGVDDVATTAQHPRGEDIQPSAAPTSSLQIPPPQDLVSTWDAALGRETHSCV
jgi:hypothetical protein